MLYAKVNAGYILLRGDSKFVPQVRFSIFSPTFPGWLFYQRLPESGERGAPVVQYSLTEGVRSSKSSVDVS